MVRKLFLMPHAHFLRPHYLQPQLTDLLETSGVSLAKNIFNNPQFTFSTQGPIKAPLSKVIKASNKLKTIESTMELLWNQYRKNGQDAYLDQVLKIREEKIRTEDGKPGSFMQGEGGVLVDIYNRCRQAPSLYQKAQKDPAKYIFWVHSECRSTTEYEIGQNYAKIKDKIEEYYQKALAEKTLNQRYGKEYQQIKVLFNNAERALKQPAPDYQKALTYIHHSILFSKSILYKMLINNQHKTKSHDEEFHQLASFRDKDSYLNSRMESLEKAHTRYSREMVLLQEYRFLMLELNANLSFRLSELIEKIGPDRLLKYEASSGLDVVRQIVMPKIDLSIRAHSKLKKIDSMLLVVEHQIEKKQYARAQETALKLEGEIRKSWQLKDSHLGGLETHWVDTDANIDIYSINRAQYRRASNRALSCERSKRDQACEVSSLELWFILGGERIQRIHKVFKQLSQLEAV